MKKSTKLKDSGVRRKTTSGAVRDRSTGKGRFDLTQFAGLTANAMQMERGAKKYTARNWEKGMPLSWFLDSALRHIAKIGMGFDDEPHVDAAIWNLNCLEVGRRRISYGIWPKKFDDIPTTYKGKKPWF